MPYIHSGFAFSHINNISTHSMARKRKDEINETQYEKNREAFKAIEHSWHTVRIGYIRDLDQFSRFEIERIYREELDQSWLPNRYCSGCYFKAVEDLIYHFQL
jgi:hypothetical protein